MRKEHTVWVVWEFREHDLRLAQEVVAEE